VSVEKIGATSGALILLSIVGDAENPVVVSKPHVVRRKKNTSE
jgi:hypothetical protein